jgi:hypothetical protein
MTESNIYEKFKDKNPDLVEFVVNVEWVLKQIDKGLDNHAFLTPINHPDGSVTNSKIADLNITVGKLENNLDLQTKSVYVKTPAGTSAQSEFPDSGGELSNTYTRSVIDSKLNLKSDVGHNHAKSDITDFPEVYKKTETDDLLDNKANANHIHPASEITGLGGLNFITVPWGQALSVDGILLEGEDNKKHYRLHVHSDYLAVDNAMEDWPTSPAHHILTVPFTNSFL